jgi:hypothetical protein
MPEPDAFPWPVRVLGVVLAACFFPFAIVGGVFAAIVSRACDLLLAVLRSASETFDQWDRQFSRWLRKWLGRR